MVDSVKVLNGQTIAYTCYCIAILLLMGWFAIQVTKKGKGNPVKPALFYSFVGMLVVLGVSLHIITYNTIPWTSMDLHRGDYEPDRSFNITVENHEFILPSEQLVAKVGEIVEFDVSSKDLTYGFGLFRADNSMVLQMQVVPGHRNDILWKFDEPGELTIRSTEYSGPKGIAMIVKNAVKILPSDSK